MFIRSGYSAQTRRRSGTEHHHHAADVIWSRRDHEAPGRRKTRSAGLGLELIRGQRVDPDLVPLDRTPAVAFDGFATALEHEPVVVLSDRGRLAGIQDAVELPDVRKWAPIARLGLLQLELLGDRDPEHGVRRH